MESIVLDRIAELWSRRQWYRDHLGWIPAQRTEDMAELRYLVALAKETRKVEAAKPDPMDQFKSYADWTAYADGELVTESEMRVMAGNR